MASLYDDIVNYIKEYFPTYSEKGQTPETYRVMDKFYASDVVFDDGIVTSREQWYKMCLSHPSVQDKVTLEHLFVDERQMEAGALIKSQAIERKSGKVLVEIKMNVLYVLKINDNKEFKIAKVKVFCESNAEKVARLFQVYKMSHDNTEAG